MHHRYDPRADKWSAVCEMDTQRAGVDVAVLNENLYSVGGKFSDKVENCLGVAVLIFQKKTLSYAANHVTKLLIT